MRRVPVESSWPNRSAYVAEPEQLDELVDTRVHRPLGARDGGEVRGGRDRVADPHRPFARDRDGLAHGERREEATVLERPPEAEPRATVRRSARVSSTTAPSWRSTIEPASGGTNPETTSNSVVLPAPFGPEIADDLARVEGERDVVERDDAAEPAPDPS